MQATRRLSLTLLLVTPLIAAQDRQTPDLSLSSVSGEHLPDSVRPQRPLAEEYDDQEEVGTSTTTDRDSSTQRGEEEVSRERRSSISSAQDLEVAEQVVFRPIFRHRQILADRKLDQEETVRQQSLDPAAASGQAYYPYQYNYYYPF